MLVDASLTQSRSPVSSGAQPAPHIAWLDGTAAMLPLAFLVPLVRPSRRDAGRQARNLLPSGTMAATSVFHGICGIFPHWLPPLSATPRPFEVESRELCRSHSRQRQGLFGRAQNWCGRRLKDPNSAHFHSRTGPGWAPGPNQGLANRARDTDSAGQGSPQAELAERRVNATERQPKC
jgi:hypothetical protein